MALDIPLAACWEVELNTGHGIPGRADQGKEGTVQVSDSPVLEGVRVGRLPALDTTPARPLQLDPPPSPVGCARCSLEFVAGSALMEPFAAGEANPVLERTNHLFSQGVPRATLAGGTQGEEAGWLKSRTGGLEAGSPGSAGLSKADLRTSPACFGAHLLQWSAVACQGGPLQEERGSPTARCSTPRSAPRER